MRICILIILLILVSSSCNDKINTYYPIGNTITLDDIKKSNQVIKTSKWNLIKVALYDRVLNDSESFDSYFVVLDSLMKISGYIYHAPYIKDINEDTIKCSFIYGDYRQYYLGEPYEIPKLKKNDLPPKLVVDCCLEKRKEAIYVDSLFSIEKIILIDSVYIQYLNLKETNRSDIDELSHKSKFLRLEKIYFEFGCSNPFIYMFNDTTYTCTNRFYFKNTDQMNLFVNDLWYMLNKK